MRTAIPAPPQAKKRALRTATRALRPSATRIGAGGDAIAHGDLSHVPANPPLRQPAQRIVQDDDGDVDWEGAKLRYPKLAKELRKTAIDPTKEEDDGDALAGTIWGRVHKDKNADHHLGTPDGRSTFQKAFAKRLERSRATGRRKKKERQNQQAAFEAMNEGAEDEKQYLRAGARVQQADRDVQEHDEHMPSYQKGQRWMSTHVRESSGAIEAQSSIKKDESEVVIAVNDSSRLRKLSRRSLSVRDLKDAAARKLGDDGIEDMTLEEVMNDRPTRHRVRMLTDPAMSAVRDDAMIKVPLAEKDEGNAIHAEIRIRQSEDWSPTTHHLPSGTRLPCGCCSLDFAENGIKLNSGRSGPIWLTGSGASQQIHRVLGEHCTNFQTMSEDQAREMGAYLKAQLDKHGTKQVLSRKRDGGATDDHDPDSDEEITPEQFRRAKALAARKKSKKGAKRIRTSRRREAPKKKKVAPPRKRKAPQGAGGSNWSPEIKDAFDESRLVVGGKRRSARIRSDPRNSSESLELGSVWSESEVSMDVEKEEKAAVRSRRSRRARWEKRSVVGRKRRGRSPERDEERKKR